MAIYESFIYAAYGKTQWFITPIGVAVYEKDGALVGSRFDTLDLAIQRGDCPDVFGSGGWAPSIPADHKAMGRVIESFGNAMSSLKWAGAGFSLEEAVMLYGSVAGFVDSWFYSVVRPDLNPNKPSNE